MEFKKNCNIIYGGGNDNGDGKQRSLLTAQLTRPLLSKFEYASVITTLAKYLFTISDISKYIIDEELNSIISPCELAYRLLNENKFDAILDRGIERVHYSTLIKNPLWDSMIEDYFKNHNNSIQTELVEALGL